MIIYKILINDKFYIGSTNNLNRRYRQHKYSCTKEGNKKYNLPLYKYIRNNGGWENCNFSIIEEIVTTDLLKQKEREQEIITKLNPTLNSASAFSHVDSKKEYDMMYYHTRLKNLCPCCNKWKSDQAFKLHQTTKKYKNYILSSDSEGSSMAFRMSDNFLSNSSESEIPLAINS